MSNIQNLGPNTKQNSKLHFEHKNLKIAFKIKTKTYNDDFFFMIFLLHFFQDWRLIYVLGLGDCIKRSVMTSYTARH
jgi:hypothetical protein